MQWGEREGRVRGRGQGSTTQVSIPMRLCLSVDVQTPDYPTKAAKHSPTKSFTYKFIPLRVHTPTTGSTLPRELRLTRPLATSV